MQVNEGADLAEVWDLRVRMPKNVYNAFVDSRTGAVLSLVDWVSDVTYTYNVYPLGTNDPSGPRVQVVNPANPTASRLGWQNQGNGDATVTISNNVYAQDNPSGGFTFLNNYRPDGGSSFNFNFPLDLTQAPGQYLDAAITNLFYWNILAHDLYYVYGFDERAGNFQQDNFGEGGAGGDAVVANAQDGSGTNNANFYTPPDGENGEMRMFIFTQTTPNRDGDLDNGIIVHEYTHGLSNRLMGGPTNVNCLSGGEGAGLGEGWGDFVATILRTTSATTRYNNFPIGAYVFGDPAGVRTYLYSTNLVTNPSRYGYILTDPDYAEEHTMGEIWTSMLFEVYWNMVEFYGFQSDWFDSHRLIRKGGNVIMLQLVIDGMKFQPCNPTFVDARNAILLADSVYNLGVNRCRIWKGFAKRGLGEGAQPGGYESNTIPLFCGILG